MYRKISSNLKKLNPAKLRGVILGALGLGVASLLTFHFTMTALALQPDNPLRDPIQPFVSSYMDPYFTQNWRLFAPDPSEPSKHLLVSCRFADGREDSPRVDVTQPHYEALHARRLSPSQRIIRAQLYPMTMVHPNKDRTTELLEQMATSENSAERLAAEQVQSTLDQAKRLGLETMARTASVECDRRYPDTAITEVQLLYYQEQPPKFSQRNDPDARGKELGVDYGWHPYQKVASY